MNCVQLNSPLISLQFYFDRKRTFDVDSPSMFARLQLTSYINFVMVVIGVFTKVVV